MSENFKSATTTDLVLKDIQELIDSFIDFEICDRHQILPIRIIEQKKDLIDNDDPWAEESFTKVIQIAMVNPDDLQVLNTIKGIFENKDIEFQPLRIKKEDYDQILNELSYHQLLDITAEQVIPEEMIDLVASLFKNNLSLCASHQFLPIKKLDQNSPTILIAMVDIYNSENLNIIKKYLTNLDYKIKRLLITKDDFDKLLKIAIDYFIALNKYAHPFYNKLIQSGYINQEQLQEAITKIEKNQAPLIRVFEQITEKPFPSELIKQYKNYQIFELKILYGLDCIEIESNEVNLMVMSELINSKITIQVCRRYRLLPLKLEENLSVLVVAMVNPDDLEATDSIQLILRYKKLKLRKVVIREEDYEILLKNHYEFEKKIEIEKEQKTLAKERKFDQENVNQLTSQIKIKTPKFHPKSVDNKSNKDQKSKIKPVKNQSNKSVNQTNIIEIFISIMRDTFSLITRRFKPLPSNEKEAKSYQVNIFNQNNNEEIHDKGENPIIHLVNKILVKALTEKASHIHFECNQESLKVRFRKEGLLQEVFNVPTSIAVNIKNRLMIMAGLYHGTNKKGIIQEAVIKRVFEGRNVEFFLTIFPSAYGDKIVIKIINNETELGLDKFISHRDIVTNIRKLASYKNGVIVLTGAKSSGKTTTAYSILAEKNTPQINIQTMENHISYTLPNITQTLLTNTEQTIHLLNNLSNQDVDIIYINTKLTPYIINFVFERLADKALILLEMEEIDSINAINSLCQQVNSKIISRKLLGIFAQKLIKKVCPQCRQPYNIDDQELKRFRLSQPNDLTTTFYKANTLSDEQKYEAKSKGKLCLNCEGNGYKDFQDIYEFLPVSTNSIIVQNLIIGQDIRESAFKNGIIINFLDDLALQLARDGITTLEEIEPQFLKD